MLAPEAHGVPPVARLAQEHAAAVLGHQGVGVEAQEPVGSNRHHAPQQLVSKADHLAQAPHIPPITQPRRHVVGFLVRREELPSQRSRGARPYLLSGQP
jgi:hypothetical protein